MVLYALPLSLSTSLSRVQSGSTELIMRKLSSPYLIAHQTLNPITITQYDNLHDRNNPETYYLKMTAHAKSPYGTSDACLQASLQKELEASRKDV
jgi:hypothetical protein